MKRDFVTPTALALGAALTTTAFLMAFFMAPPTLYEDGVRYDLSFQIFYFHVPVAEASFLVFAFAAFYAIRFLVKKDRVYDTKSRIAMEATLMFVILTMMTGILWTRARWNVWWEWEPRLTTYFIMMLLVIGYFVLRNSVEDEERRATYAAVFGIIAFLDAPLSFAITRIVPSGAHPVVFRAGGGLDAMQITAFVLGLTGMLLLGYAVFQLRLREELAKERIEALKASIEG